MCDKACDNDSEVLLDVERADDGVPALREESSRVVLKALVIDASASVVASFWSFRIRSMYPPSPLTFSPSWYFTAFNVSPFGYELSLNMRRIGS